MIFDKVLDTRTGQIIISIILGLGLAMMFNKSCSGKNCYIVRSPNPKEIEQNVYQFENDCYKFSAIATKCGKKENVVKSDSLLI
jgi:hypothetical protein